MITLERDGPGPSAEVIGQLREFGECVIAVAPVASSVTGILSERIAVERARNSDYAAGRKLGLDLRTHFGRDRAGGHVVGHVRDGRCCTGCRRRRR